MNKTQYYENLSYQYKLADKTRQKAFEEMKNDYKRLKNPNEHLQYWIDLWGYKEAIKCQRGSQLIEMFENELPDLYEFEYKIEMYSDYSDLIYPNNYDGFCDENYEEKDIEYLSYITLKYTNKETGKTIIIKRKPGCYNDYKLLE